MCFLRNIDEGGTDKALTRDGETQKAIECEISLHSYFIPFHSPELSILTILVKDIRHEGHKRQRVKEVSRRQSAFAKGLFRGFGLRTISWTRISVERNEHVQLGIQTKGSADA